MLSVLITHKKNKLRELEETFRDDRYVYGVECGDDFMWVLISKLMKSYILNKCSFLCVNNTIKYLKKRERERPDYSENREKVIWPED